MGNGSNQCPQIRISQDGVQAAPLNHEDLSLDVINAINTLMAAEEEVLEQNNGNKSGTIITAAGNRIVYTLSCHTEPSTQNIIFVASFKINE